MALYGPSNQLPEAGTADLQQPRSDLQPTTDSPQQVGETSGSSNLSQEQLTEKQLRVGNSTTTVQNTTTNASYASDPDLSSTWIWFVLLVLGMVVLVLLLWKKRPQGRDGTELAQAVAAEVEDTRLTKTAKDKPKKKTKPAHKPKSSAKRKARK